MLSTTKKLLCALPAIALVMAALIMNFTAFARAESGPGLNETEKAEVRQLIKDYMRENPEVVVESFKMFQEKQQRESLLAAQEKIVQYKDYLAGKDMPSAGNPNGDITVVEFFDYNCGYCKKAITDINHILETDKNVRFVFIEMPILGPTSLTAALWAHAAHKQGKYFEFHKILMEHNGAIEDAVLEDAAKKAGLDLEKAKKDIQSEEIGREIDKGITVAREIGVQGTPGFVIEGQLFPGYLGEDGLKKAIDEARAAKKS
ncbi:MAG: DsbA family protein [Alphaproteobacteria bacterium]